MGDIFGPDCKLSESERAVIRAFIKPRTSACDGCGMRSICDSSEKRAVADKKLLENAKGTCLICGGKAAQLRPSKVIPGVFSVCVEHPDEFTFEPITERVEPPVEDSPF